MSTYDKHEESHLPYQSVALSQAQQRIWLTQSIYPKSSMYNIGGTVLVKGKIDLGILEQAIVWMIKSYDAFSIRLVRQNQTITQYFCQEEPHIGNIDFSVYDDAENRYKRWEARQAQLPFEMLESPLYLFCVFKLQDDSYGYFIKLNHIIADGWSIQMLTKLVHDNYIRIKNGKIPDFFPEYNYQSFLADEKEYLNSPTYNNDKFYWTELLKNTEGVPEYKYNRYLDGKRNSYILTKNRTNDIQDLCKKNNITANAFFISTYLLHTYREKGLSKIIIGIPVLGRKDRKQRSIFGMCVSTMPVLFKVNASLTLIDLAKEVGRRLNKSYVHQRYPYNHLLQEKNLATQPLFDICVNYYGTHIDNNFDGNDVINTEFYNGQQVYALQMIIREWSATGEMLIELDTANELYSHAQVEETFNSLVGIIDLFLSTPEAPVSFLRLGIDIDNAKLLSTYNRSKEILEEDITIVDLFERQVALHPNRMAVECEGAVLTYHELDQKIQNVCNVLGIKKIVPGTIIGIMAPHSIEMLIIIWGVLRYGCAFLPIDPKTPKSRAEFMLSDADAQMLITNVSFDKTGQWDGIVCHLKELHTSSSGIATKKPSAHQLAYVIYTSGSSGQPKGVLISHANLFNYICWAGVQYVREEEEVFALYTSIAFDLTITTLFTPLTHGGSVIIYPDNKDEHALYRVIDENRCTVVKLTPSHLLLIQDKTTFNSRIKRFIVGGEDLKAELAKRIFYNFNQDVEIINEYGPTEATVGCMIHRYDPIYDTHGSVPIGKPAWNTEIFIMDSKMQMMPFDMTGEIFIAGSGVSQGYLNREDLNDNSFIMVNIDGLNKRLYRTGDYAKLLDGHTVVYCGRNDSQVKIRGHRIELQEIEAAISKYKGITSSFVSVIETQKGLKQLCAYYTASGQLLQNELREFLKGVLQPYMMPSNFIQLEQFPLTNNGKIDKSRLPLPYFLSPEVCDNSWLDHPLLVICSKVLGIENIALDDNYFNLGGDSISAIQISSKLRDIGYVLSVKSILENPFFKDMEKIIIKKDNYVEDQGVCEGDIDKTPITDWFFAKEIKKSGIYCQELQIVFTRMITKYILEIILEKLVEYHDILRVNVKDNNVLFYNNSHLKTEIVVPEYSCISLSDENLKQMILTIRKDMAEDINLSSGLLFRSCLFTTSDSHLWHIVFHHLIMDVVSLHILLNDITTIMRHVFQGQEIVLPNKTLSYQAYAKAIKEIQRPIPIQGTTATRAKKHQVATHVLDKYSTQRLISTANERYSTKPVELLLAALLRVVEPELENQTWTLQLEGHGRNYNNLDLLRTVGWFTALTQKTIENFPNDMQECIIWSKETVRDTKFIRDNAVNNKLLKKERSIRLNYLGEFQLEHEFFRVEPVFPVNNELLETIELDAILTRGQIVIFLRFKDNEFHKFINAEIFILKLVEQIDAIINFCCKTGEKHFTPSDFSAVFLTQEDIDSLFEA